MFMTQETVHTMLKTKDVMRLLRVSSNTVKRWRDSGRLPYTMFPAKTARYAKADIERILKEGI